MATIVKNGSRWVVSIRNVGSSTIHPRPTTMEYAIIVAIARQIKSYTAAKICVPWASTITLRPNTRKAPARVKQNRTMVCTVAYGTVQSKQCFHSPYNIATNQ